MVTFLGPRSRVKSDLASDKSLFRVWVPVLTHATVHPGEVEFGWRHRAPLRDLDARRPRPQQCPSRGSVALMRCRLGGVPIESEFQLDVCVTGLVTSHDGVRTGRQLTIGSA